MERLVFQSHLKSLVFAGISNYANAFIPINRSDGKLLRKGTSVSSFANCFSPPITFFLKRGFQMLFKPSNLLFFIERFPTFADEFFGIVVPIGFEESLVKVGEPSVPVENGHSIDGAAHSL